MGTTTRPGAGDATANEIMEAVKGELADM